MKIKTWHEYPPRARMIGWGATEAEAIADLMEQIVALRDRLQALVSENMATILSTGKCPCCEAVNFRAIGVRSDLRHNEKCALRLAQEELERTR